MALTDPDDNLRSNLFGVSGDGSLVRRNREYLPAVRVRTILDKVAAYKWLGQHSQLFGAVRERAGSLTKKALVRAKMKDVEPDAALRPAGSPPAPHPAQLPYGVALTRALLIEAARVSRSHHAEFLVFEVPITVTRTSFRPPDPRLRASLPPDIAFVSPLSVFRLSAGPNTLIYYEHGAGHWTPLGNRLAARAAFQSIFDTGYLSSFQTSRADFPSR